MGEVYIKGKAYTFIKNYKNVDKLRASFNNLTQNTFGFDFEGWYQNGYWGDSYIPYSIIDGNNIVANVSISIMEFAQLGQNKKYIQIGTVMTDTEYRNRGLAKYLMDKVLEEWKDNCHNIYLFANDSVLDFYPRFGFITEREYSCSKDVNYNNNITKAIKLDMTLEENRRLLIQKANEGKVLSKLEMINNVGLIMFYCTSFFADMVYYLKNEEAIAIAEVEDNVLKLYGVFCKEEINLDNIIDALIDENIKKVVLGFTPKDTSGYNIDIVDQDDTELFILKEENDFYKNKLMFPILSHT